MRIRRPLPVVLLAVAALGVVAGLATAVATPATVGALPGDVDGPRMLVVDDDGYASIGSCDHRSKTHKTIAEAIRAARDGDTIFVCPGTYPGDVVVNKKVTIVGPNEGVDPREKLEPGAVVTGPFIIEKPVTIDGLIFEGVPCGPAITTTAPITVRNSVFRNNAVGLQLSSNGSSTTTVQNNVFIANNAPCPLNGIGIYSEGPLKDAVIEQNQFYGHTSADIRLDPAEPTTAEQIVIRDNQGDRGFCIGRLVDGKILYNHVGPEALPPPESRTGALAAMGQAPVPTDSGALHHDSGGRSAGVGISGSLGDWGHPALQARQVQPATAPPAWAVHIGGGSSDVTVAENTLVGATHGVQVDFEKDSRPNTGLVVDRNCIAQSLAAGMSVQSGAHAGGLMAEQNWWGSGDGPSGGVRAGTGDAILDPDNIVDADPHLLAPPGTRCPLQAMRRVAAAGPVPDDAPAGGVPAGAGGSTGFVHTGGGWRFVVLAFTVASGLLVARILRAGPRYS